MSYMLPHLHNGWQVDQVIGFNFLSIKDYTNQILKYRPFWQRRIAWFLYVLVMTGILRVCVWTRFIFKTNLIELISLDALQNCQ